MRTENYFFGKWQLVSILLAGTIVRFIYGYYTKAWMAAPDQLAWGLSIDAMLHNNSWSYLQLAHAPHEGGSFFIGLLSILFRPLQFILPSLSWAALVVDAAGRLIQVKTTQKIFGNRTAFWFGIWSIISVPVLIPWGTVNFGLHSLASFLPFLFLYFAGSFRESKYSPVWCGVICGFAVSFSYDSVVLVVAAVLFLWVNAVDTRTRIFSLLIFFAVFSITMLPHLFTRLFAVIGFSLGAAPDLTARWIPLAAGDLGKLFSVWYRPLPGSFLLSAISFVPPVFQLVITGVFLFSGIVYFLLSQAISRIAKWLPLSIVFLFIAAYALSPFNGNSYNSRSYVYYRHLAYIIPLITVIIIAGFVQAGKFSRWLLSTWILLCGLASCQYLSKGSTFSKPAYRPAGWIIAHKYGDNITRSVQVQAMTEPVWRQELWTGFGWGLSAAILKNQADTSAVRKLAGLIRQYPQQYQPAMIEGVRYSFAKTITPVLDPRLLEAFEAMLLKNN
jgi:hypothetical protein